MKDEKGHGSEARAQAAGHYDGKPVYHGYTAGGDRVLNASGNPISYASAEAAVAGAKFTQDQSAANELARGNPKSGAAPVHPGAAGPQYDRQAVNNAIASSNRAGRRIGGREAKMIHALLKGRH